VRLVGRITDWNDDKGFGFVVPHGGGVRAFVHVKAFPFGSRRPVEGDLISYAAATDPRGRTNATDVRFAGQRMVERREPRRDSRRPVPRRLLGVGFLLAAMAGAWLDKVPAVIAIAYAGMSFVSYLAYWRDKDAAGEGAQRIPELKLHFFDLLGGWPGALVAQQQFRHKTVKASFQSLFWVTALANIALFAAMTYSGATHAITELLLGG